MTSPKAAPKATALKARVEALESKLDEAIWYIGELQYALKMIIAQAAIQQLAPMVQQKMQQEIMDKLNAGGIATGLSSPKVGQRPLG